MKHYLSVIAVAFATVLSVAANAQEQTTVDPQALTPQPSLSISSIPVTVVDTAPKVRDFVALYPHGADNKAWVDWVYVACDAKNCPAKVPGSAPTTVHLSVPSSLTGQIDIRLVTIDASGNFTALTEIDP